MGTSWWLQHARANAPAENEQDERRGANEAESPLLGLRWAVVARQGLSLWWRSTWNPSSRNGCHLLTQVGLAVRRG